MTIRNSITAMRTAVIGTLAFDGPQRAVPLILDSTSAASNVFGRAFTYKTANTAQAGGAGAFAGIMTNPHAYAIDQVTAKNSTAGEFLHMGEVFVKLVPAVATGKTAVTPVIGSKVYFVAATGELTVDPTDQDAVPVSHKEIKGAVVSRHTPVSETGGHLAVISLTGLQA